MKRGKSPIQAIAGTTDKGDALFTVKLSKKGAGIEISLASKVMTLYGDQILAVLNKRLKLLNATDLIIDVQDQGALDYVLKGRLETAVRRALKVAEDDR